MCYLLLHLGVPSSRSPVSSAGQLQAVRSARRAGKELGIRVWPSRVFWPGKEGHYRYFFRFPRYRRDDVQATHVAEAVLFAVTLTHGPFMDTYAMTSVFRVPSELVRDAGSVPIDWLIQIEEERAPDDRTLAFPATKLDAATFMASYHIDAAWKITPVLVRDAALHQATQMLKASKDDFYVWPGGIVDVVSDPGLTASSGLEQNKLENALQNAFKAIECVLGDPPKDDTKFFAKLKSIGLDPCEKVGYIRKLPLHQVIREMNVARDKKAAHGSTPRRAITVGEMLEYQACADLVLWVAIENRLGETIY